MEKSLNYTIQLLQLPNGVTWVRWLLLSMGWMEVSDNSSKKAQAFTAQSEPGFIWTSGEENVRIRR